MNNPETMKHFVRGFYYAVLGNSICHIHFRKALDSAAEESDQFIDYICEEHDRINEMPLFMQLAHEHGANTSYDDRD
jgi:hypothetical protein